MPQAVLVTGASGKTGALVVSQLLKLPDQFEVRAVVRSAQARQLMLELGVSADNVFVTDLAHPGAAAALKVALQGCAALVVCTSAVPQPRLLPTLLGGLRHWLGGKLCRQQAGAGGGGGDAPFVPVATWKGGQTPQQVDFEGQVFQFDAAKACAVAHVVLVSSAGGCDPHHFLNHIGSGEVAGRRGNILNWKRLAEQHLVASGLTYTILHPNHLIDDSSSDYQLVLGVDDTLQQPHWRQRLKMPRSLLAQLAVQSLLLVDEGAGNRSIDCAGRRMSSAADATTTTDQFRQLLAELQGSCDYTINDRTKPDAPFVLEPQP